MDCALVRLRDGVVEVDDRPPRNIDDDRGKSSVVMVELLLTASSQMHEDKAHLFVRSANRFGEDKMERPAFRASLSTRIGCLARLKAWRARASPFPTARVMLL